MNKNILPITLIGSGNLAFHLGKALVKQKISIVQNYSKTKINAVTLAQVIHSDPITDFDDLIKHDGLYIIAVPDQYIVEVAIKINKKLGKNIKVVHTSGATSSTIFDQKFNTFGVFYPLQSFSKNKTVQFEKIPILIASNQSNLKTELQNIAKCISEKVYSISDEQRSYIHVCAVFVNNFTNKMFQVAEDIAAEHHFSFDILMPLVEETVNKIKVNKPSTVQTGPAIRKDYKTIEVHRNKLRSNKNALEIYDFMTKTILSQDESSN